MTEEDSSTNQSPLTVNLNRLQARANAHISTIDDNIKRAQNFCELKEPVKPETYELIKNWVASARQVDSAVHILGVEMTKMISPGLHNIEGYESWHRKIAMLGVESAKKNKELFGLASIIAGWLDINFTKSS